MKQKVRTVVGCKRNVRTWLRMKIGRSMRTCWAVMMSHKGTFCNRCRLRGDGYRGPRAQGCSCARRQARCGLSRSVCVYSVKHSVKHGVKQSVKHRSTTP